MSTLELSGVSYVVSRTLLDDVAITFRPGEVTALSGPSAGVAGAAWIASQAGFDAIATFDMGGTSTDVAFVRGGASRWPRARPDSSS